MSKLSTPLTAIFVRNVKYAPDGRNVYSDGRNLYLKVLASNEKRWILKMRCNGRMSTFPVGSDLSLKDARDAAGRLRAKINSGENPNEESNHRREIQKSAKLGIGTFESVIEKYFDNGPGAAKKSRREQKNRIKSVFAKYLSKPALELEASKLQIAADDHGSRNSASRAVGYLNPILKWAARRKWTPEGITIEKPVSTKPNDGHEQRHLTDEELSALLPHFNDHYGRCAKFLLLTAARKSEATDATWGEVDLENHIWLIETGRRKDTRKYSSKARFPSSPFKIPLSRQAIDVLKNVLIIEEQRRRNFSIQEPILPTDLIFTGPLGGRLVNWDRWLKIISRRTQMRWSAHALRRTAATILTSLGFDPHIVSTALGHKNIGGQLLSAYNKSHYSKQHKEAMNKLGEKIESLTAGGRCIALADAAP